MLALRLVGMGFYVGLCIVLGMLAGLWLDGIFDTKFIWLVGLLLGIIVAFTGLYQLLKPLMGDQDKEEKD